MAGPRHVATRLLLRSTSVYRQVDLSSSARKALLHNVNKRRGLLDEPNYLMEVLLYFSRTGLDPQTHK